MPSSVSLKATFVWRLFADGKLTVGRATLLRDSFTTKLLNFVVSDMRLRTSLCVPHFGSYEVMYIEDQWELKLISYYLVFSK